MKRMIEATENGNTDEIERLEEYKKKIDKVVHLETYFSKYFIERM